MQDIIAQNLGAAETLTPTVPTVVDHHKTDDFESKVQEFRQNAVDNVTLDFNESRQNMRQLITTGMDLLPVISGIIESTESEKAIIAATGFMKMLGDLNKSLVDMGFDIIQKGSDSKTSKTAPAPTLVTNGNANIIVQAGADTNDVFARAAKERQFKD